MAWKTSYVGSGEAVALKLREDLARIPQSDGTDVQVQMAMIWAVVILLEAEPSLGYRVEIEGSVLKSVGERVTRVDLAGSRLRLSVDSFRLIM